MTSVAVVEEVGMSRNTLRLELRCRNNRLWHAIFDKHASVSEFCREHGLNNVDVGIYLNLKRSPWLRDGELSRRALAICFATKIDPEQLFPAGLYRRTLGTQRVVETHHENVLALGDMKPRELLLPGADDAFHRREELGKFINALKPREAFIVRKKFGLDGDSEWTLEQIGEQLLLTRERVRVILNNAMSKLRKAMWKANAESAARQSMRGVGPKKG